MTNKKALEDFEKLLKDIEPDNHLFVGTINPEFIEAAIEALRAQDSKTNVGDMISRQATIDAVEDIDCSDGVGISALKCEAVDDAVTVIKGLPSAQPEYEPVTAEDFAKTMSEYTVYRYMAWHGEALALMKEQGFVICKKTM